MSELRLVACALIYVVAMALAGIVGYRQLLGVWILGLMSFCWLTFDKLFEGRVLIPISSSMGVTASDLVGFAGLAWAAWLGYYKHRLPRLDARARAEAPAPTSAADGTVASRRTGRAGQSAGQPVRATTTSQSVSSAARAGTSGRSASIARARSA